MSPTGRHRDLVEKRAHYEQAGVPLYWLVDPAEQTLTVLELVQGRYAETQVLTGQGELSVLLPFPVTVAPFRRR